MKKTLFQLIKKTKNMQKIFNGLTVLMAMYLTMHTWVFVRFLDGSYHDKYFGKEFGNNVFYHPKPQRVDTVSLKWIEGYSKIYDTLSTPPDKYYWASIDCNGNTREFAFKNHHPFKIMTDIKYKTGRKSLLNWKEITKEEFDLSHDEWSKRINQNEKLFNCNHHPNLYKVN